MSDHSDIVTVVTDCERYWRETGVPPGAVTEMRAELQQHLIQVLAEGRSAHAVVGSDLPAFAEAWAAERRSSAGRVPSWEEVTTGKSTGSRRARFAAAGFVVLVLAAAGLALAIAGAGDPATNVTWRWLWTSLAIIMGLGEIFTASFFLLPFAVGAVAAATLAWLGVQLLAQWLVFFFVSGLALAYVRQFMSHQDDASAAIGANRYLNSSGIVTARVDAETATGMVRVETEEWRATTDGQPLEPGAHVIVVGIRGARLVVAATDR
ncbi:MAG: NfeD family protein [Gemmatimonadota bacterium]|jgi:membrane protein implicated in regulation of membrane protease activity